MRPYSPGSARGINRDSRAPFERILRALISGRGANCAKMNSVELAKSPSRNSGAGPLDRKYAVFHRLRVWLRREHSLKSASSPLPPAIVHRTRCGRVCTFLVRCHRGSGLDDSYRADGRGGVSLDTGFSCRARPSAGQCLCGAIAARDRPGHCLFPSPENLTLPSLAS